MYRIKFSIFAILILLPTGVVAQQVSPIPEFEKKIRNGTSIRMRSVELERIKRGDNKLRKDESVNERNLRLDTIRKDFESIQRLQDLIIKAYTKGKKINYSKIAKSSQSMSKTARRLDIHLFGRNIEGKLIEKESEELKNFKPKSVRVLIIELDKAIGEFVVNPVFEDLKTIDSNTSLTAQTELKKIINLGHQLFRSAENKK